MKKIYFALLALSSLFAFPTSAKANDDSVCLDGICPSNITSSVVSPGVFIFTVAESCQDMVVVWQFGDATELQANSTQEHNYTAGGVYVVTATFEDSDCGAPTTLTTTIFVELPVCDFSITQTETSCGVFNFGISSNVEYTTTLWTFGDGGTSDSHTPTHHFSTSGPNEVSVQITSACGTTTASVVVQVSPCVICPTAMNAEQTSECGTYVFHVIGFGAQGNITWDFGDGATSGGNNNISHHFTSPGTYTISTTAWTGDCPNGITFTTTLVVPNCTVDCPLETSILEQTCDLLVMTATTPINEPIHWTADGIEVNVGTVTTFQLPPGNHVICASLSNANCGSSAITHCQDVQITACENCPTSIETNHPSCGNWSFTLAGAFANENEVAWFVNGDNTVAFTGETFEFTPTEIGCYTIYAHYSGTDCPNGAVLQTIVCHNGCNATPCPTEIAVSNSDCHHYTFHLPGMVNGNVVWNFGDQTVTIGGVSADHNYNATGEYVVTATYTSDACNNGVTLTQTILVSCTSTTCPTEITSSVSSTTCMLWSFEVGPVADNISIAWDFGDGSTSQTTSHLGQHQYTSPGLYTVNATYISANCPSGISLTTTIEVQACASLCELSTSIVSQQCSLLVMTAASNMDATIHWNIDNVLVSTTGALVTFNLNPGVHSICAFYETNTCGLTSTCTQVEIASCTDCSNVVFTIDSAPSSGGPTSIGWGISDAISSQSIASGTAQYTNADPYYDHLECLINGCYTMVFESEGNLLDNSALNINIMMGNTNIAYDIDTISTAHHLVIHFGINSDCSSQNPTCSASFNIHYTATPGHIEFENTSTPSGSATYSWNFGNGHFSDQMSPSMSYSANGVYEVCLTITTADGCSSTYCHNADIIGVAGSCDQNSAQVVLSTNVLNPDLVLTVQGLVSFNGQIITAQTMQIAAGSPDTLSLCLPTGCYSIALQVLNSLNTEELILANMINNATSESILTLSQASPSTLYQMGLNTLCETSVLEQPNNTIQVYPNPASNELHIAGEGLQYVRIFDSAGRMIYSQNVLSSIVDIDLSSISSGLYHLQLSSARGIEHRRFEVVK